MKRRYRAVVVGSGYGGAIAASRLARAGQSVCVLERGREFAPGEFPATATQAAGQIQFDAPQGRVGSATALNDFRVNDDVNVWQACGLGGGSLINSNVVLRPEARVFDDPAWPERLRRDRDTLLEEGYRRADEMLRPTPYPASAPPLRKLRALETVAAQTKDTCYRPPIAVSFEDKINQVGVAEKACTLCGQCNAGCNYGAKKTLTTNYLPDAVNHGADIFTEVSVRTVERAPNGYRVYFEPVASGRASFDAPPLWVEADIVVLAAGTLGTSEVLLRSRGAGLGSSAKIGERFSADGGLLSFAFDCAEPVNCGGLGAEPPDPLNPVGPGIAGTIDFRDRENLDEGWVVQEGSHPTWMTHSSFRWYGLRAWMTANHPADGALEWLRRQTRFLEAVAGAAGEGATRRTMDWLVIGHDSGEGRLHLENDRVRISWPGFRESRLSWAEVHDKLRAYTKALGGSYMTAETMFTTHPLGGCVMADRAEDGVVNDKGQVFSGESGGDVYEGLYVCDGAAIPRSLGINPLFTIAAVAERCVGLLARDRGWTIDYGFASVPARSAASPSRQTGFAFTETLRGRLTRHAEGGSLDSEVSTIDLVLTIECDDIDRLLETPPHSAPFFGSVTAPLLSRHPLMVEDGVFDLLARGGARSGREMRYRMTLASREGRRFSLTGHKELTQSGGFDVWTDTTTLFVAVQEGESLVARGVVKIEPGDFLKQISTWRAKHGSGAIGAVTTAARVGSFLGRHIARGNLEATRGHAPPAQIGSQTAVLTARARRLPAAEEHSLHARDGALLRLRRFRSIGAPVVLTHCAGVSSEIFATAALDTSLAAYLADRGHDVWLLDLRTSSALDASKRPYDLDDVARHDYPAALEYIVRATEHPMAHVVAHGIGGVALLLSLLGGHAEGLVRSAVCMQTALHFRPMSQRMLTTSATLRGLFSGAASPGARSRSFARAALSLYGGPDRVTCADPVCRAGTLAFGLLVDHDRVTTAAHDALVGMLATPGARFLAHMNRLGQAGCAVDASGGDAYLPNLSRLELPLSFIHGAESVWFAPTAATTTHRLLSQTGRSLCEEHVLAGRAHFNLLLARDAPQSVFSIIDAHLERWSEERPPLSRAG